MRLTRLLAWLPQLHRKCETKYTPWVYYFGADARIKMHTDSEGSAALGEDTVKYDVNTWSHKF